MLQTRDPATVTTAIAVAVGLVYAALYGPQGGLFSAQFPPEVRSGISLAVQVSGAIGGGLAPLVATSLLAYGGGDPRYIVWYLSALGLVAIASALHAPAHALRAAGRRPPGGPPMKPSHLDYYFWLNSDWPTWAPTA